ncbi:hypothetical protein FOMG_16442 [Fusarium oxysporum f. sp. melonis 26406]|uniref:Ankyrin repeat protein n=1 Tax=Fusarium oxysporum f. sp. melonis 26406 TaxID=1089452 RepID=W9Z5G7_FUSOX|nr:hypothetical protein FOMG_16442 [Fusarium oxysporum f. sp. melonis 26406]
MSSSLIVRPTHVSHDREVFIDGTVFPSDAFTFSPQLSYTPPDGTYINVPPLCHAVVTGPKEDVQAILTDSERTEQFQRDLDYALFFANHLQDAVKADLLLSAGANPGRPSLSNGLHGAASQGLLEQIDYYVSCCNVSVDVRDETLLTPIIYAIGLDSPHDWDTIKYLFRLGASPATKNLGYTYAQIARERDKEELAQKLETYKAWVGPLCKKSVYCVEWKSPRKYTKPRFGVRYTHPEFPNEHWDDTSYQLVLGDEYLWEEANQMWKERHALRRLRKRVRRTYKSDK